MKIDNQELFQWAAAHKDEQLELLKTLAAIPAPSHHEELRVAFIKDWLIKQGAEGVTVDEALNVKLPIACDGRDDITVYMAHTDVVFPDMTPLPVREEDGKLFAPGVGDDTANVVGLLMCVKYLLEKKSEAKEPVLIVLNSCEEGLGNLKGCRAIAERYGKRMERLVSFDGYLLNMVASHAVGSHRSQVTVKTEGGHSFGDFGNRNAIAVLSNMINALYSVKVPTEGDSKTTYNVGSISGGTSVNTICQEATMLYEYRSDNHVCLEKMRQMFEALIAAYRAMGLDIEVELLGERPCAANVDEAALAELKKLAANSVQRITGSEAKFVSASTDCNIPLSLGIPSVCMGVCVGSGLHTRGEVLQLNSLPQGSALCMDFLCNFF